MIRTITICFRTSEDLRSALERISKEERRSVSSTIENILFKHLADRRDYQRAQEDKRRYPRKMVTVPALVREIGSDDKTLQAGIVLDLSLGGLQISLPDNYRYDVREDKETSRISIIFTLPDSKRPLTMQCVPNRVYPSDSETRIGAYFIDTDFASHQALQNYLVH
jgi:hypothetical protein